MSVEHYTRLERGNAQGFSDSVLDALVHALQLDDAEPAHLFGLARASSPGTRARRLAQERVRAGVQQLLDAGHTLVTYTAEPGSASSQALRFLASWAATLEQAPTADRASEQSQT